MGSRDERDQITPELLPIVYGRDSSGYMAWGQNITTTLKLFGNQVFARESVDDFGRTWLRSRDGRRVNRCVLAVIAHRHRRVATFELAEEYFTPRVDGST